MNGAFGQSFWGMFLKQSADPPEFASIDLPSTVIDLSSGEETLLWEAFCSDSDGHIPSIYAKNIRQALGRRFKGLNRFNMA